MLIILELAARANVTYGQLVVRADFVELAMGGKNMANEYFTPAEIKLKRKRRATRMAMYGAMTTQIVAIGAIVAVLCKTVLETGAKSPTIGCSALIISGCFLAALCVNSIGAKFHARAEHYRMELERRMNVV